MGNCRDCKWWEAPDPDPYAWHEPVGHEWGECQLGRSNDGRATHAETRAIAVDSEVYYARLATHPDFGCVQFEA